MSPPTPFTATRGPGGRVFTAAAFLFFCSGALGLGYELVWIKKAALVVGSSQIALSTVLTSFFLGLGCGSYFVGRYFQSLRWSPLVIYGLFEVAIALFAFSFPVLFRVLETVYGALYPFASGSAPALFAVRFFLLFFLFLVPTFFMGGTLPLLLDGLIQEDRSIGPRTSLLYGINILGAVLGVLFTSYFAIPRLGMDGTSHLGGAANLTIGIVACLAFRRVAPLHMESAGEAVGRFFPLAAFASGLLAMGYQISWARYFTLFNLSTVYLTSMLLLVYLLALAAGSFLLAPLLIARWKPLSILALAQAVVPLSVLITLEWWLAAEYRFAVPGTISESGEVMASPTLEIEFQYKYHWRFLSETLDAVFCAPLFQVALVIFLPVVFLGVGLPALIAAAVRRSSSLRRVSGRLVFWNTLGSSAGSFFTGYALLPLLGLHWTLFSLGLGSLGLAAAIQWQARALESAALPGGEVRGYGGKVPRSHPAFWVMQALTLLGVIGLSVLREDISRHTIKHHGCGRDLGYSGEALPGRVGPGVELVQVLEGPLNSSFVFDHRESIRLGSGNVYLALAYKNAPSTQAIQGHIPCLFYPGTGTPENCLGLCLGSGQSFGALLLYPIKLLDVVEISGEILQLSLRHFAPYNHELARDPRVKFHLDDARHFVERAPSAWYDVVSMEPPPPTAEGVYSLYSLEFYQEIARILRPGGVFMQWLPLHQLTPQDTQGIIKTQAEVFPETFVVKVGHEEFMVVSYPTRPRFQSAAIEERCRILERGRFVKGRRWNSSCRYELASLEGVLSLLIMGPEEIRRLPAQATYRDDNQILSYSSGDRWLLRRYQGPLLSNLSFAALTLTDFSKLKDYFHPPLPPEMVADLSAERAASLSFFNVPDPGKVAASLEAFRTATVPGERQALALALAETYDAVLAKEEAYSWIEKALQASPTSGAAEHLKLARKIANNRIAVYPELTERWIRKLRAGFPGSPLVQALEGALSEFRAREAKRLSGYLLR